MLSGYNSCSCRTAFFLVLNLETKHKLKQNPFILKVNFLKCNAFGKDMTGKDDLDALVKKATVRGRFSTDTEMIEVFGYLNERLQAVGLTGEVVSVLTRGLAGKLNCYGQRLDDGRVWARTNMSIGVESYELPGNVTSRKVHRLTSYQEGVFVPGDDFGVKWKKSCPEKRPYIALVNIPIQEGAEVYPYSPRS